MSINSNSTNLKLDTVRHSFAHLMAAAVQIYFKQENNINQKLSKILKESLATGRQIFVDCLILNQSGEVFAQKRSADRRKFPNCWDLPGGGLESGENIWECVKRELLEELQFELTEIVDVIDVLDFELPIEMREDAENYEQRVIQIVVKVLDYSKPILEQGKAVNYKWINLKNQEILLEGRSNPDEMADRYTFDTVQKGLDYKPKNIQFGIGPVIENGCYYDFILPRNLVPEDLKKIEKIIRELIKKDLRFEKKEWELSDAIEYFKTQNQPLKVELLENLRDNGTTNLSEEEKNDLGQEQNLAITTYSIIDAKTGESIFSDLCKGPHVDDYTPNPLERGLSEKRDANVQAITELGRFSFNNNLVERAKEMLENPTIKESLVWNNILKSKLTSFKFTQQKIIDNYILDFYCSELLIAIELDGDQHLEANNLEYDKVRDNLLNSFGIKVIRILNDETSDIELLTKQIKNIINQRKNELSSGKPPFKGVGGIMSGDVRPLSNIGFSLDKFSASYWRGDQERGINMQRLYALVFETAEELDKFKNDREEAKKRDHRVLGEQLELFTFSDIVGKGLPLWLEKGATIKRILERFIVEEEIRRGYRHVETPDMARLALYEKSGHYPYYKESMYAPIEIDGDSFMLRPMTCPHHFQIYSMKPRSYKELPMRIAELAKLYRYEDSGALSGLTRVRCFCLADSHIVCTPEQAKDEAKLALDLIEYCAKVFGLEKNKDYRYELSLGDRSEEKKYFKDDQAWDFAEQVLREVLIERGEEFIELSGEAAFYGPKIDIQMKNISGKESTAFTVQYDFVMPKRFELKYLDADQKQCEAIVIHRSSIGALERVFAFLTEFYAGKFPFWLAPEQIRILTINDQVLDHVNKITDILNDSLLMKPLKYNEIRHSVDKRSESLGKKIREAKNDKIPMLMVVGLQDVENNQVSIEYNGESTKVDLGDLKTWIEGVK